MLNNRLKFAQKSDRDVYVKELQDFLGKFPKSEDNLEILKISLKTALEKISQSQKEGDKLFNNMQLAAVYTFEAAFLKEVRDKINENKDQYLKLYEELYGKDTDFAKKLEEFKSQGVGLRNNKKQEINLKSDNKSYSISRLDIQSNPSKEKFDANLEFSQTISDLLDAKTEVVFKNTNYGQIISFLANIDPQILAHIVVNQEILVKIENDKTDILHECIASAEAILFTTVDVAKLVLPAGTVAAAIFITLGASVPITVGVALVIYTCQLTYMQDKNIKDNLDENKIIAARDNMINNVVDKIYGDEQNNLIPQQISQPIRLLNLPEITKNSIEYVKSSYKSHRYKQNEEPDLADNLSELILYSFNKSEKVDCSKTDLKLFKDHCKDLVGLELQT